MTYISGFVIPVPKGRKDDYRKMAEDAAAMFRDYGALEMLEGWEEDVRDGEVTDFRRAVHARPDEAIVFSWVVWPDRATADAAEAKMMANDGMTPPSEAPFDMQRMIFGGFSPLFEMGRNGEGQ